MQICTIKNNLQFELWHQMLQQISLAQVTCCSQNAFFPHVNLKIIEPIYLQMTSSSLLSGSTIFEYTTAIHFAQKLAAPHPSKAIKKHPSRPRERKVRQTAKPQFLNQPLLTRMALYHCFMQAGRGGHCDLLQTVLGSALLKSVGALWMLGRSSPV